MTTNAAPKITATQRAALAYFAAPEGERTGRFPHGATINSLTARGLLASDPSPAASWWSRVLTDAGRAVLEPAAATPAPAINPRTDLTDQQLLLAYMQADVNLAGDVEYPDAPDMDDVLPVVTDRFGRDGLERLASWCTGVHASGEDMVALARDNWDRCQQIMAGLTLSAVAAAINDDVTLNAQVRVEGLGGNVQGLVDLANGLVISLEDGQSAVGAPATVWVTHEDDASVEVATGTVSTVEDVLALYGTVVGRG